MKVNYDFSGRVVLIAGAGSGIGLAMTQACLAAGATVLASDIRVTALSALQHPKCHVAQLDITDSAAVNRYVAQQSLQHQRIDAAVLASGIQQRIEVEAIVGQVHVFARACGVDQKAPTLHITLSKPAGTRCCRLLHLPSRPCRCVAPARPRR